MPIENVFEIDVDIKSKTAIRPVTVTQNDAVVFIFRVFDEGRIYNIQDGTTFTLVCTRPDKVVVITEGIVTGVNIVEFELGTTELEKEGKVEAVIQVYDADGRVSTIPFSFTVLRDPSKSYVPNTNEQTLIERVLGDGPQVIANAETATANANNAASSAKTIWQPPVANYATIATAYPTPQLGWTVQVLDTGFVYRYNGTTWTYTQGQSATAIADINSKLSQQDRQTQIVGHGLSVLNGSVSSPADVEIYGRTLVSLGTSVLSSSNKYVLASNKYRIRWSDETTVSGIAKFVGRDERPAVISVGNLDGKVLGSFIENPHILRVNGQTAADVDLLNPTNLANGYEEVSNYLGTVDGEYKTTNRTVLGVQAQQVYSFNLVEEVERKIGKIPYSTLSEKVLWLKNNLERANLIWYGFGFCPSGNKATLSVWKADGGGTIGWNSSANVISTSGTVTKANIGRRNNESMRLDQHIDSNGFIHFIVYTDASDGVTTSTIRTDYVELEVEIKTTANYTVPSVPLYQVNDDEYNKILVDWNEAEIAKRYPRVQGVKHVNNPYILAEGENLLPPFTEWSLHANAKVISPYELELNASAAYQTQYVDVKVGANRQYSINNLVGVTDYYIHAHEFDSNGTLIKENFNQHGKTLTTSATTSVIRVYIGNMVVGKVVYKNPIMTLGSTQKPFVPRNPSRLYCSDVTLCQIETTKDVLFKQDGRWKLRKVISDEFILDGNIAWRQNGLKSGFKWFYISSDTLNISSKIRFAIDDKGALMGNNDNGTVADGIWISGQGAFTITVSDSKTGFGSDYQPLVNEIKAYFNGWKAKTSDETGKPTSWQSVVDGTDAPTQTLAYVSANVAPNYTPYKLYYALATPQISDVTDKVEGDIVVNGLTQIQIDSGFTYTDMDGKRTYTITPDSQRYLTTVNATEVKVSYANNIRSALDDAVTKQSDIATNVSINSRAIVDLYVRLKALEMEV